MISHESSLKTIDRTVTGSLLSDVGDINVELKKISDKNIFTIDNLLTGDECNQIIENSNKYDFSTLDSYSKTVRDSTRLCIFDNKLSLALWNRIKDNNFGENSPFGFSAKGKWEPAGINNCLRLSKYIGPSNGFKYHFDSQYCYNFDTRSIFSLVIYLNDNFKDGQTILYQHPNPINVGGLTVDEEIKLNGGIDAYEKLIIEPNIGKCLIFPHNTLHASNNIVDGTKIIIRTDIIYERTIAVPCKINYDEYMKCLQYFREAQNLEIDQCGDVNKIMEYYERSLSIRKSTTDKYYYWPKDTWMNIFNYLSVQDQLAIKNVNRLLNAYSKCYKNIFWGKMKRDIPIIKEQPNIYIPILRRRKGTKCMFVYLKENKKFFHDNKDACLRVVAMYALYLFGQPIGSKTYIATYDSERQSVVHCTKEWLLKCAFYQLPCYGTYYHLYQDKTHDITSDKYDTTSTRTVWREDEYGNDTSEEEEDEEVEDEEEMIFEEKSSITELFDTYVDSSYVKNYFNTLRDSTQIIGYFDGRHNIKKYQQSIKNNKGTGYHLISYNENKTKTSQCTFHGSCDPDITEDTKSIEKISYNNLICDFSKHKLNVNRYTSNHQCRLCEKTGDDNWIVKLEDKHAPVFNHASCNYGIVTKETSYNISYEKYVSVDHVQIEIGVDQYDNILLTTNYHGIGTF